MKLNTTDCNGMAWIKNGFRVIHKEPRPIRRGRNKGKYEVVVRLYAGVNGLRKRIVEQNALREVFV